MKKTLVILLSLLLLLGAAGCAPDASQDGGTSTDNSDSNARTVPISWWMGVGEDSTYYPSYDDNPVVRYTESKLYAGNKVDLTFQIPIAGAERDNFSTILATEQYASVMDMAHATSGAAELLEDGVARDLTDYVDEYMPNYRAILNQYPDLAAYTYTNVDGKQRIVQICSLMDSSKGTFMGHIYRRDWVAKYGKNPKTGEAFTFGYTDPNDKDTWYDDVVFPSWYKEDLKAKYLEIDPSWDGTIPVYLSDWEWMFDIFTTAMKELGITDGYCYSPYYMGFAETGDLFSGFGGGGPLWYKDREGNAQFGADGDSMLSYLECMNTWYQKGWISKHFMENSTAMIYSIDTSLIFSGKIGLWVGRRPETGSEMDTGDSPLTKDIMAIGCRIPINDLYGKESTKYQVPYTMYQDPRIRGSVIVTTAVSDEDLPTVLAYIDSFYTLEGGEMLAFGLTKEQFEESQEPVYIKYGLTEGAHYKEVAEDGSVQYVWANQKLIDDTTLATAVTCKRMNIGYYGPGFGSSLNAGYKIHMRNAMAYWDFYLNTGYPDQTIRSQFSTDESNTYMKVHANVLDYMSVTIPKFISGASNFRDSAEWNAYTRMVKKYAPGKVTEIYQNLFDKLKGE